MKTKMRGFVALLMAAMIMAGMIPAHSEAKKVTYYKTKKVFLQTKETKIVKTNKENQKGCRCESDTERCGKRKENFR